MRKIIAKTVSKEDYSDIKYVGESSINNLAPDDSTYTLVRDVGKAINFRWRFLFASKRDYLRGLQIKFPDREIYFEKF